MNYREFAPIIPYTRWMRKSGKTYANCPRCSQRQVITNKIVDGFTEGSISCSMPNCSFKEEWVRLEGWDDE